MTLALHDCSGDNGISNLDRLLSVAEGAQNILVFTGSGLSASSGALLRVCDPPS